MGIMKRIFLSAGMFAFFSVTVPAHAAPVMLPTYDYMNFCDRQSSAQADAATANAECVAREDAAIKELQTGIYPSQTLSFCQDQIRQAGESYVLLLSCLRQQAE